MSNLKTQLAEIKLDSLKSGLLGLAVAVAAVSTWPIESVNTGYRGVITVGGSIKSVEEEGFTFVAPWQRLNLFNIRAEQADIKDSVAATLDQQPITVSLTVRYAIIPDKVSEVFEKYSKTGDLQSYVETATSEAFKAVTARYSAQDLIVKRAEVSNQVLDGLRQKLLVYGANVISIDMRDFKFDDVYMKAVKDKVTQEQLKLGAENQALTVEQEQKKQVIIAKATAESARIKADADAYTTMKAAEALAKSLEIQNEALSKNRDVLQLKQIEVDMKRAEQWDGKLPTAIYAGAPIPFLNSK
jgi:prohibitin 2